MIATARIKFSSEARPSQYILLFGNTEPTCIPLSGHFKDIEGRVLVHQTERYKCTNAVYLIMPHGYKGWFQVLIFAPPFFQY